MVDLKVECSKLRELGKSGPTEENLNIALMALQSKFESIQVTAGKVLSVWGGTKAAAGLRGWLIRACQKPKAHALQSQAAKSLAPWLKERDANWVLDLYFGRPKSSDAYFLLPLISALPWKSWRDRVAEEAGSSSVVRRRAAALVVARSAFPNRRAILEQMSRDTEPEVRSLANYHLRRERAAV